MVASLQHKKEALEAKLRDKTSELRKLCIEEAELTGVLPSETPLEPGESPPQFRRRVGTAFTYPENLINKLRSKEDEALAALELECKIQTGIAEAAKGLANDGAASKSVRRKHRSLYEDSQRRLSELEARLTAYRQAQPKQKKKPRPLTEFEETNNDGEDVTDSVRYPTAPVPLPERNPNITLRHSHTYGGLHKSDFNVHPHHHRVIQSQMHLPAADYRYSLLEHHHYIVRSNNPSPVDHSATWNKGRDVCNNHHQPPLNQYAYSSGSPLHDTFHPELVSMSNFTERFGSLDRNSHYSETSDTENRTSATLPRNSTIPHSTTVSVLLPNQTYPESSLMRTQSLGNMDNLKHLSDRKIKEKEWYETSLDSSPTVSKPESPFNLKQAEGHVSPQFTPLPESPADNSVARPNQASINNIQFDTVVPYESPKNHTVVQAGKWQPYREVTKPFEMSDFYKYSTKYRQQSKAMSNAHLPPNQHTQDAGVVQQKGVYKAPIPLECQALSTVSDHNVVHPPITNVQHYEEHQPPSESTWYRNKAIPKPRSSTLV